MANDKNPWGDTFTRALQTSVRALSPHVPLEPPPGLRLPRPTRRPARKRSLTSDSTLLELFQELTQLGRLSRDEVTEFLLNSILGRDVVVTSGQQIADIRVDLAGQLVVVALDGKPLDPAEIMVREGAAKDNPIHPGKIAAKRAEFAAEDRERELVERLKALSAPSTMPAAPPTSMVETELPLPVAEAQLPPARKRGRPSDRKWGLIIPKVQKIVDDNGPFDILADAVETVDTAFRDARRKPFDPTWTARWIKKNRPLWLAPELRPAPKAKRTA